MKTKNGGGKKQQKRMQCKAADGALSVLDAPDLFFNGYAAFRQLADARDIVGMKFHLSGGLTDDVIARLAVMGSQSVGNVLLEAFFWYDHAMRMRILQRVGWFDPFSSVTLNVMLDVTVNSVQLLDLAKMRMFNFLTFVRLFCYEVNSQHASIVGVLNEFKKQIE